MSRRRTTSHVYDGEDMDTLWTLVKEKLVNKEYWITNTCELWDVTAFDTNLSNQYLVNKREAHCALEQDLNVILDTFIHHPTVTKCAKNLKKDLNNLRKNESNKHFWKTSAPVIQKTHIDRQKNKNKKEGAFLDIETSLITSHAQQLVGGKHDLDDSQLPANPKKLKASVPSTPSTSSSSATSFELSPTASALTMPSKSSSTPSTPSSVASSELSPTAFTTAVSYKPSSASSTPSKSSSVTSSESSPTTPPPVMSSKPPSTSSTSSMASSTSTTSATAVASPPPPKFIESDSIFSDSSNLSLATIIKRKAVLLHDQYKSGDPLSARQRKIMSNGLSSILDLVDQSFPSQRSLFLRSEWHDINQLFALKYTIPLVALDQVLVSTWKIIYATVKSSRNIKTGLLYLYRIYGKHQYSNIMSSLKIYELVLDLLDQEDYLLRGDGLKTTPVSENDYLSYVWIPLFRRLLPNEFNIRVKSGDTSSNYTSMSKQEMYPESVNIGGFKVDLRFVVVKDGVEFDICSVEAACNTLDDTKIVSDEGKLAREVKDNLDAMISMGNDNNNNNSATDCYGWGMQITGVSCSVMSLHLSDTGLYVALPRFDLTLPRSIADLEDFDAKTMPQLHTLRQQLLKSADWIFKHATSRKRRDSLNRMDALTTLDARQRDTWYTPPKNTESRHPPNFIGLRPPPLSNINVTLLSLACENLSPCPDKQKDNGETDTDEFGWRYDEKQWHNWITDEYSDDRPYD